MLGRCSGDVAGAVAAPGEQQQHAGDRGERQPGAAANRSTGIAGTWVYGDASSTRAGSSSSSPTCPRVTNRTSNTQPSTAQLLRTAKASAAIAAITQTAGAWASAAATSR